MSSSSGGSKYPPTIANGKFEITAKLGAGCFGEVYRAVDTRAKDEVAIKIESVSAGSPQLERESAMLSALAQPARQQGFPELLHFGREGKFLCMALELLGESLENRVGLCGGRLSAKSVALAAEQALLRVEYLHSRGIVHRDIKPENLIFGLGAKQHHLYLIDFGLSKRYYDRRHVRMNTNLSLTGTARYASINVHRGIEQSRRDDLEALGHMFCYLLRGSLPWSGLSAKDKEEKFRKIKDVKERTPLSDLCLGYPDAFERYLWYCRALGFRQRPDYTMLRGLFSELRGSISQQEGCQLQDHEFEWNAGKELGGLEPLASAACLAQPDDGETSQLPRTFRCFCGL
jgi:serine/threonine protein kinase